MAFVAKALADGQLSNSIGAIFTATADIATYIRQLTLYNTSATTQTITLYIKYGSTNRAWRHYVLELDESADALEGGQSVLLSDGDSIQAVSTTNAVVDYTVAGVEEA